MAFRSRPIITHHRLEPCRSECPFRARRLVPKQAYGTTHRTRQIAREKPANPRLSCVAALPSNLTWRSVRRSDSMKLPGTTQILANSARCPDCAGRLAFKSSQPSRWRRANSDICLQQCDFIGGQIEQRIDLGVDFRFQPGDFGGQGVDFGAAGGDPAFPIIAFLKRDSGL
jgi:hypothetical protein